MYKYYYATQSNQFVECTIKQVSAHCQRTAVLEKSLFLQ